VQHGRRGRLGGVFSLFGPLVFRCIHHGRILPRRKPRQAETADSILGPAPGVSPAK
jgi:hypothetical protein